MLFDPTDPNKLLMIYVGHCYWDCEVVPGIRLLGIYLNTRLGLNPISCAFGLCRNVSLNLNGVSARVCFSFKSEEEFFIAVKIFFMVALNVLFK
jgi:hypothetical protein